MLHTWNIYNVINQCYLNENKTNMQNWKLSEAFIALVSQLYNSLSTFTYSVRESVSIYWSVCNLTSGQSQVSVTDFWHQPLAPCLPILISGTLSQLSLCPVTWAFRLALSPALIYLLSAPLTDMSVCLMTSPRVYDLWLAVYINELIWSSHQLWNLLSQSSSSFDVNLGNWDLFIMLAKCARTSGKYNKFYDPKFCLKSSSITLLLIFSKN